MSLSITTYIANCCSFQVDFTMTLSAYLRTTAACCREGKSGREALYALNNNLDIPHISYNYNDPQLLAPLCMSILAITLPLLARGCSKTSSTRISYTANTLNICAALVRSYTVNKECVGIVFPIVEVASAVLQGIGFLTKRQDLAIVGNFGRIFAVLAFLSPFTLPYPRSYYLR